MIQDLITSFDLQAIWMELVMIITAILIGALIGGEREYRNKSAGLRTFILVSFGSCVFTILSIKIGIDNPDRLAANIITGIGFLGAGVIFKDENKVSGITTATTIWATASLGMSAGSGHLYLALLGTAVVMIVLRLLLPIQDYIDNHHKIREYKIVTAAFIDSDVCIDLFHQYRLKYILTGEQNGPDNFSRTWQVTGKLQQHEQFTKSLIEHPEIIAYQF